MDEFDNGLGEKWDYDMTTPVDSEVSISRLQKFIKPTDTLIFYGGEPLVMMDKMKEIMDNLNCRFVIQTNGILLNQLPTEYLLKLDKMLVSIDGNSQRTNFNRGINKYETIIKNLKDLRRRGFTGEIVTRSAISFPDLYEQIMHLISLIDEGLYDSIHWQIDAEFYQNDFDKEKFTKFVKEYNESVDKLLNFWIEEIKVGRVRKIYPFLGIFDTLYYNKKSKLPCGSGHSNFTINTKGELSACPIMNSVKNFYCGSIEKGVERQIHCSNGCEECSYFDVCGGRCLYSNQAQLWPKEGHDLVCDTIKFLIDGIKKRIPEIKELIESGIVSEKDFEFEKYFGPEIIP